MHLAVEGIGYLVGTWRGEGRGLYPTIDSFAYAEELTFSHPDPRKPVLTYSQRTWNPLTSLPMHSESGFWRPKLDGSLEVVLAQSTGLVEVQKGTFDADHKVICLKSDLVGNASKVKDITRVFNLVDGELSYVVEMATALTGLQPHLKAVLRKV
ncbi:peroxynitrite isomerase Rv2717c [Rhodamnia argentea]|uniref:Peroxynitrite isomerase Rv2717c n=1 Tax=Rhodamnia argentea TaxID=178133 RepID=A0A8B8NZY0_9MYRT|nr:peroxynitrite isomerase Rv2717c [Rhodamnia argentea]